MNYNYNPQTSQNHNKLSSYSQSSIRTYDASRFQSKPYSMNTTMISQQSQQIQPTPNTHQEPEPQIGDYKYENGNLYIWLKPEDDEKVDEAGWTFIPPESWHLYFQDQTKGKFIHNRISVNNQQQMMAIIESDKQFHDDNHLRSLPLDYNMSLPAQDQSLDQSIGSYNMSQILPHYLVEEQNSFQLAQGQTSQGRGKIGLRVLFTQEIWRMKLVKLRLIMGCTRCMKQRPLSTTFVKIAQLLKGELQCCSSDPSQLKISLNHEQKYLEGRQSEQRNIEIAAFECKRMRILQVKEVHFCVYCRVCESPMFEQYEWGDFKSEIEGQRVQVRFLNNQTLWINICQKCNTEIILKAHSLVFE